MTKTDQMAAHATNNTIIVHTINHRTKTENNRTITIHRFANVAYATEYHVGCSQQFAADLTDYEIASYWLYARGERIIDCHTMSKHLPHPAFCTAASV